MIARLLLNPAAGRGRGARLRELFRELAARAGIGIDETSGVEDLAERARSAAEAGVERLLVAGGDGTWHHAANALAGSATALAPVPVGTGNDLARELGYPLEPEAAFRAALAGTVERIDLGRIGSRYFCGVAGVGFDAAVAEHARTRVRRLRGPAVYAWATLATLARFRPPRLRLESDSDRFEGDAYLVAFANTSHYGGGMRIAPDADPADGLLDVVVVRAVGRLRLLAAFPRIYRGTHARHPAVEIFRTTEARAVFDREQLVNADGEHAGTAGAATLRVGVEARALAVVRSPEKH